MNFFVTAIGTDSGKTLTSAILCEALQADYWKPIQAGIPMDSEFVKSMISNPKTKIHPERYLLRTPASPHAAAKIDGIEILLDEIRLPQSNNTIVVEGAGGCLVPINDDFFIVDIISRLNFQVVLVANLYLGSINHTLLTVEALKRRNVPVFGIVFNGDSNTESEKIILRHSGYRGILSIAKESVINKSVVKKYAEILKRNLHV